VTVAENGEKAIELLESTKFDLILMDIQMPALDGIEATKEIRSRGWDCPIVGVTASFQRSQMPFYQQVEMNDCVGKPILLKGLRSTISEHVQTKTATSSNEL
jgi:CheY-like chemotaxis protein